MKKIIFGLLSTLMVGNLYAEPAISVYEVAIPSGGESVAVDVATAFNATEVGKQNPGFVHFNRMQWNGANPATHFTVWLYNSRAEQAAYMENLRGSPEFLQYLRSMDTISTPVRQMSLEVIKNWGEVSNDHRFWVIMNVSVQNPALILSALDDFNEAVGERQGEAWLLRIAFGGDRPSGAASHQLALGYKDMLEWDEWNSTLQGSEAYVALGNALRDNVQFIDRYVAHNVKIFNQGISLEDVQ